MSLLLNHHRSTFQEVTNPITFEGNANTIARSPTASAFRIAQVNSTGGGILNFGAVTLTGSHLTSNTVGGVGSAIYSTGTPAAATFTSSTVETNTAHQAAGIASINGALTNTSSAVTANTATSNPGGIYYIAGSATLNTSTVTANTPTNCNVPTSPIRLGRPHPRTAQPLRSPIIGGTSPAVIQT